MFTIKQLYSSLSSCYANLPLFASAMSEFYDSKVKKIQEFVADVADDDSTESSFITLVHESPQLKTIQAVALSKSDFRAAMNADIPGGEIVNLIQSTGDTIQANANDILQDLQSAYVSCVTNSEVYRSISKQQLSDKINYSDLVSRLSTRLDSKQISSLYAELSGIFSSSTVGDMLGLSRLTTEEPVDFNFNFDNYTGLNAFSGALINIGDDIAKAWSLATKGINIIRDGIGSIGKAIGNLVAYLLSKLFHQLTVDYTLNEKSTSMMCDMPVASFTISRLALKDLMAIRKVKYGGVRDLEGISFGLRGTFTNSEGQLSKLKAFFGGANNILNVIVLLENFIDDLSKTIDPCSYIFPKQTGILLIHWNGSAEDTFTICQYVTAYSITAKADPYSDASQWFHLNLEQSTLDSNTFTNEQVANLIYNAAQGLRSGKDGALLSMFNFTQEGETVQSHAIPEASFMSSVTSPYMPVDLVNAITFKNVTITNIQSGAYLDLIQPSAITALYCLIFETVAQMPNLWRYSMGTGDATVDDIMRAIFQPPVAPGTVEGDTTWCGIILDSDSLNDMFIPYTTNPILDTWIHPQTDRERAAEVQQVLLSILGAAAAAATAFGLMKLKRKIRLKKATLSGQLWNAESELAENPSSPSAQKNYLKASRKDRKWTKLGEKVGLYDSSTGDDYLAILKVINEKIGEIA